MYKINSLIIVLLLSCFGCGSDVHRETSEIEAQPKILTIITGSVRGSDIAHQSLERHLLKPYQADLFLFTETSDRSSYLHKIANYFGEYKPSDDWRKVADEISMELFGDVRWRNYSSEVLGESLIGKYDENEKWTGIGTGLLTLSVRYNALKWLKNKKILDKYKYFVVSRTDYYYMAQHPAISELLTGDTHVAIPFESEDNYGICDRHAVLDREGLEAYLNAIEVLLGFHLEYGPYQNIESVLKAALKVHGFNPKRYRSPSYMVRADSDGEATWSKGSRKDANGLWIKSEIEYQEAVDYLKALNKT